MSDSECECEVHQSAVPAMKSALRGSQSPLPATKSALRGLPTAVPATKSALRGSPSAVPATRSALRGSQSAVPATKSATSHMSKSHDSLHLSRNQSSSTITTMSKALHLPRKLHFEVRQLRSLAPVTKSRLWSTKPRGFHSKTKST